MDIRSSFYDFMIYMYALSLLFYFSDFVGRNQNAKRMGTGLLIAVWVLQTFFFMFRMYDHRYMPMITMFEILFFFSWLMVTMALVLSRFFRIDALVFFVNVIGFAILALNLFSDSNVPPALQRFGVNDELLFIHITLAVCSYAAFSIAAIFAGMYLFLHRKLKSKNWSAAIKRLPSLETIERYTYYSIMIGTPLLILSLSLGIAWILLRVNNTGQLLDPKVLNSMLVIAAYGFYLTQRISSRSSGRKLALWSLGAFSFVLANLFVSNFLSQFHRWIG